jgi:hypothetical protein
MSRPQLLKAHLDDWKNEMINGNDRRAGSRLPAHTGHDSVQRSKNIL